MSDCDNTDTLKVVESVLQTLIDKFSKTLDEMTMLKNALQEACSNDAVKSINSDELHEKEDVPDADLIMNHDYNILIQRRIDAHKNKNLSSNETKEETSAPPSKHEETAVPQNKTEEVECNKEKFTPNKPTEADPPIITPLHKLNLREQDELFVQIFKEACFNVEKILQIDKEDEQYSSKVKEEADRLLQVWIDINKKK